MHFHISIIVNIYSLNNCYALIQTACNNAPVLITIIRALVHLTITSISFPYVRSPFGHMNDWKSQIQSTQEE